VKFSGIILIFQHNHHRFIPALSRFFCLMFLSTFGFYMGFYVVTIFVLVFEVYIFIVLYSLLNDLRHGKSSSVPEIQFV
jgi:uncharacterized membrane protein